MPGVYLKEELIARTGRHCQNFQEKTVEEILETDFMIPYLASNQIQLSNVPVNLLMQKFLLIPCLDGLLRVQKDFITIETAIVLLLPSF